MDRKDPWMHKILTALAFSIALLPAVADDRPASSAPDGLQGGLMQANLVVSPQGAQRKSEPAALKGSLRGEAERTAEAAEADHHHTTGGMLLAALALMAGIVLRRWGDTEQ